MDGVDDQVVAAADRFAEALIKQADPEACQREQVDDQLVLAPKPGGLLEEVQKQRRARAGHDPDRGAEADPLSERAESISKLRSHGLSSLAGAGRRPRGASRASCGRSIREASQGPEPKAQKAAAGEGRQPVEERTQRALLAREAEVDRRPRAGAQLGFEGAQTPKIIEHPTGARATRSGAGRGGAIKPEEPRRAWPSGCSHAGDERSRLAGR
jgi:hypothetical protein